MKENVKNKIQVLIQKAENNSEGKEMEKIHSRIPNPLADHIKTEEQAKNFMLLLRSL